MKHTKYLLLIGCCITLIFSCKVAEDVTPYAPIETYPSDTNLSALSEKRAMIIVAHDDDMCLTAGTISKLNTQGWEIRVLSLPQSAERNAAQRRACKDILDSVIFFDLKGTPYRNDLDTVQFAYEAIHKSKFPELFNTDLIESQIIEEVNSFEPSVIFSLDNEVGGYGHPDHVMMSQLVLDLANSHAIKPSYIYQSVYTEHMMTSIMERHSKRMISWGFSGDLWTKAKQVYEVDGMPEPNVQIDIQDQAEAKMNYLNSYNERERKTIGMFIPAFYEYDAEAYFQIFNREFYRVIAFDIE